ncbi:hypothetical protein [Sporosarcina sp. HYO08]|uniref:YqgU-like beta propeller domain-containing protein n=1 Tax=Sporosarcina sp. HYO08 TaxID=1759557 RepID=UPI0007933FCA|nr:hypothetical protein [Sporosarcina sp. HYO08]KXH87442.1 hypothetical protein AU377_02400 [Sporosarcina sp. HYO08]
MTKRWSGLFVVLLLCLTGCVDRQTAPSELAETPQKPTAPHQIDGGTKPQTEEVLQALQADPATFHFIVGWLDEEHIVYVEKINGSYQVKKFNIATGKQQVMVEEPSMIIDCLIHPSKKYLLLHTGDNPIAATVKMMTIDGEILDEVSVASSELGIQWNDIDPSRILLTAFYEDWTFDVFLYDRHEEFFGLLDIEDPFPKWFGDEQIIVLQEKDHSLDGGSLYSYNVTTKEWKSLQQNDIIYFDTYEDSLVTMKVRDESKMIFSVYDPSLKSLSEWTLPAVSNYSEWVIPNVEWLSKTKLVMTASPAGGQLDELSKPYQLLLIEEGLPKVVSESTVASKIQCAPSGKKCLTGYGAEMIVDVETGKEMNWLLMGE